MRITYFMHFLSLSLSLPKTK